MQLSREVLIFSRSQLSQWPDFSPDVNWLPPATLPGSLGMLDTIFLDLDGPLLDGRIRHYRCYADILADRGFEPVSIDSYWEMKRSLVSRRDLLDLSGASSVYDQFLAEWLNRIESPEYLRLDRVHDGVIDQLRRWKTFGMRLVLVTMRSNRSALIDQLRSTDLLPYLSDVIDCDHVAGGAGKAARVLEVIPDVPVSRSLWIGDTEADLEAARKLGCPVCLLSCGLRAEEILVSLRPDFLWPMLRNVEVERCFLDAN